MASASVWAREDVRFDHRGSIGLLMSPALELSDRAAGGQVIDHPGHFLGALGVSVAVGENGNELKLLAQGASLGGQLGWSVVGGYRGYFGRERFKTFLDLDARLDVAPAFDVGPRIGLGVQWEATQLLGLFAGIAGHVGVGNGILFTGNAFVGIQVRSYLLE